MVLHTSARWIQKVDIQMKDYTSHHIFIDNVDILFRIFEYVIYLILRINFRPRNIIWFKIVKRKMLIFFCKYYV